MQSGERAARLLREQVAPALAAGLTFSMRDQPSDPSEYLAEYVSAYTEGAHLVLSQHRVSQECAQLDAELLSLKQQVVLTRAERKRRLPNAHDGEAERNATLAAASWSEIRRLKRLVRSMKIKAKQPLGANDWPIPEGLLLAAGGRALGGERLCAQLKADFGVGHVNGARCSDALGRVLDTLDDRPHGTVLLEGFLSASGAREQVHTCIRRAGAPTALLLLQCDELEHARRIMLEAAEIGQNITMSRAETEARAWASDAVSLDEAAREAGVPVMRVDVSGEFTAAMTAFLVACTSV